MAIRKYYRETSFEVPIYMGRIWLIHTNDCRKLYSKHNLYFDKEPFASTCEQEVDLENDLVETRTYIVFNTKTGEIPQSIGNLAHECFHVTNMLFERKGIKPDLNNDEPQAYLLGYLMDEAYKFFYKNEGK